MKRLILIILFGLCASPAGAQGLELPPVFASGMVLQQQADVELWGEARPGARVRVRASWTKARPEADADAGGRWWVTLRTPEAVFEPRTLTVESGG